MNNTFLLKSSINNEHKIICQDNIEITLEKIDSTFAKLFFRDVHTDNDSNTLLSHVKGLNILSRKSLFMNYGDDEAIKKYNQKANVSSLQQCKQHNNKTLNECVLDEQKQKTAMLSKQLHSTSNYSKILHNSPFSQDYAYEDSDFTKQNKTDLNSHLMELKLQTSSKQINASSKQQGREATLILLNPYKLRTYSFVIPEYITLILNITPKSKLLVYCPVDLNSPLESSEINYLFPIVFNTQTKLAAQIPLSIMDYPEFSKRKLREYL